MPTLIKRASREIRHRRIRARISGTSDKPRLSVFRSNTAILAQLIDDEKGHTLVAISSNAVPGKTFAERAHAAGKEIAVRALALNIKKVVFDRGGFIYKGKIKAVADGAREGGLIF